MRPLPSIAYTDRPAYLAMVRIRLRTRQAARRQPARRRPEYQKAWRDRNRDKISEYNARRRAKRAGAHSLLEWTERLASTAGLCVWCGQNRPLTKDHVVPLCRGGENTIDNLVP